MGVAMRRGPRKKRLDRLYLYTEYLMHYFLNVMKKLIFSLLPLDQNPELMNPSVKFP